MVAGCQVGFTRSSNTGVIKHCLHGSRLVYPAVAVIFLVSYLGYYFSYGFECLDGECKDEKIQPF